MPEGVIEMREIEVRKKFCWILIFTACLLGMMPLTALAANSEDVVDNGDSTVPQSADVVTDSQAPSNELLSAVGRVLYGGSTPMGDSNMGIIVLAIALTLWAVYMSKK